MPASIAQTDMPEKTKNSWSP